jgi:uracil-DNA glycosylase
MAGREFTLMQNMPRLYYDFLAIADVACWCLCFWLEKCYVTNAAKQFQMGAARQRRLHQKPNSREITACRPWWQANLKIIQPRCLVCLDGTAARAVFEREVKVLRKRGSIVADSLGGANADHDPSFRADSPARSAR